MQLHLNLFITAWRQHLGLVFPPHPHTPHSFTLPLPLTLTSYIPSFHQVDRVHRVIVLKLVNQVLDEKRDEIPEDFGVKLIELAVSEMTREKVWPRLSSHTSHFTHLTLHTSHTHISHPHTLTSHISSHLTPIYPLPLPSHPPSSILSLTLRILRGIFLCTSIYKYPESNFKNNSQTYGHDRENFQ